MKIKILSQLSLALLACAWPSAGRAGGIMLYEISSADIRLASAGWSSRAQDPSTAFTNPAGMTRLDRPQVEFGMQAINAHISFNPHADTTIAGSKGEAIQWFPAGSFFYVQPVNECLTLGVASVGYFGADLKYNNDWVGRYYVKHSFLEGFSVIPSAAYKVSENLSVGVGANVMYGIFRQKSAINNVLDGLPDGTLKLHDVDLSAGAVAGVLYEFSACTRLGLQYLSPVSFTFKSKPKFSGLGGVLEDVLTATGLIDSQVRLKVRVPQSVIVSLYHSLDESWAFMFDAGWQQWSTFQKAMISLPSPTAPSLTVVPNYLDTWHVAVGAEYNVDPLLVLSAGIAYDSSAVSNNNRTPDFPIGEQWRFGSGLRWFYSDDILLDLSYEFQWSGNLHLDVNRGVLTGHVAGTYANTYVQFINANLTWKF